MQFSPHELKDKLLRALDQDQNVVDLCAAQEVISILEKYPITREALEQTRIGRTVNDIRKKTSNADLAKRAKKLVRKWQTLIQPSTPNTPTVNGEGLSHGVTPLQHLPPHLQRGSKPNSPASRPTTPHTGVKRSNASPNLPLSRPTTPATPHGNRISPKSAIQRPLTPSTKPASPALAASTPHGTPSTSSANVADTPRSHFTATNRASSDLLSKTNVANKRKRRAETAVSPAISEKVSKIQGNGSTTNGEHSWTFNSVINGSFPSTSQTPNGKLSDVASKQTLSSRKNNKLTLKAIPSDSKLQRSTSQTSLLSDRSGTPVVRTPGSLARTSKVKTTAELIQDLQSRKNLNVSGSETITKITLNQIEKEHDTDVSIVPAGAKPRPRKTPGSYLNPPVTSDVDLSRTKNDMVHKFLATSVSVTPETDLSSLHFNGPLDDESPQSDISNKAKSGNVDSGLGSSSSDKNDLLAEKCDTSVGKQESEKVKYLREQHPHIATLNLNEDEILRLVSENPFALLPPIESKPTEGEETLNTECADDTAKDRAPVTDADLECLHNEHWSGVNGHYDHNHDWHSWTQTCSLPTVDGDLLHILPYVCLDK